MFEYSSSDDRLDESSVDPLTKRLTSVLYSVDHLSEKLTTIVNVLAGLDVQNCYMLNTRLYS